MKRRIFRLCVFLLLGVIVSFAVAWCCILGLPPHVVRDVWPQNERQMVESENIGLIHRFVSDAPMQLQDATYGKEESRFGWTQSVTMWSGDNSELLYISSISAGWPTPSVRGALVHDSRKGEESTLEYAGAIRIPDWARPKPNKPLVIRHGRSSVFLIDFLPYGPIWPGFAINTIFYAAILFGGWLPFAALLGAFRRRRRIKRGLCPKCGYDLRGACQRLNDMPRMRQG